MEHPSRGSCVKTDETGATCITTRPLIGFAQDVVHTNATAYSPSNALLALSESWEKVASHRSLFETAALTQGFEIPAGVQSENRQKMSYILQETNSPRLWPLSPRKPLTALQLQVRVVRCHSS